MDGMKREDFIGDVPIEAARVAHAGTSFTPDRRGDQEREGYAATLAADFDALARIAATDEKRATLAVEFARYREGFKARTLAHLQAKSRCLSAMITGPARFPVARNNKANAAERKRSDEVLEYRGRALDAIRKVLCPELRPIMAGDSDATTRLRAELADEQARREWMKKINAAHRAGGWPAVEALPGVPASMVKGGKRTVEAWGGRGAPFMQATLTNCGARIRRIEARLKVVERAQAQPSVEAEGPSGIRLEDDPPANRVRLYFPGKPDAAIRDRLKGRGFRWAPSVGAWQAYRNHGSLTLAREIAGVDETGPSA